MALWVRNHYGVDEWSPSPEVRFASRKKPLNIDVPIGFWTENFDSSRGCHGEPDRKMKARDDHGRVFDLEPGHVADMLPTKTVAYTIEKGSESESTGLLVLRCN